MSVRLDNADLRDLLASCAEEFAWRWGESAEHRGAVLEVRLRTSDAERSHGLVTASPGFESAGLPWRLLDGSGRTLARGVTDESGRFELCLRIRVGALLRLRISPFPLIG